MMVRSLTAAIALVSFTAAAYAHAGLKSSSIEDGATLVTAPSGITFEFTAEVGLASVQLETADGRSLETGFSPDRSFAVEHTAPLPELSEGAYVLEWRALARDGHVMTGEVSFSVTGSDA
ncbi:conserved exported hypothetical protein [Oceanicaulis sp. 350]|nr:conserved exported hypothetical protein [Oceanicaulis sp. 350]